jgi:hypothetical protein
VKDHHQKIRNVAAMTESSFLSIMPHIANHFYAQASPSPISINQFLSHHPNH